MWSWNAGLPEFLVFHPELSSSQYWHLCIFINTKNVCNTVTTLIAYNTLTGVRVLHSRKSAKTSCCWPFLTRENNGTSFLQTFSWFSGLDVCPTWKSRPDKWAPLNWAPLNSAPTIQRRLNSAPSQLSATSIQRRYNWAPTSTERTFNTAPFFDIPMCSTQRPINSALIQLSACKKNWKFRFFCDALKLSLVSKG